MSGHRPPPPRSGSAKCADVSLSPIGARPDSGRVGHHRKPVIAALRQTEGSVGERQESVTGDRDLNLITDGRSGWVVSQVAASTRRWGGRVGPRTCGEYLQQLCLTPPGREGVDLYLSAGWQI